MFSIPSYLPPNPNLKYDFEEVVSYYCWFSIPPPKHILEGRRCSRNPDRLHILFDSSLLYLQTMLAKQFHETILPSTLPTREARKSLKRHGINANEKM